MRFQPRFPRLSSRFMPFADVATAELPLSRLLRLSLFQFSVGLAAALLIGTLNRIMIIELHVSAGLVALMVALPLLFAPFRALIGHRSDRHKSVLGWRRVPYIWIGTWLQFGGLAIMPFALILLSGDTHWPMWFGEGACGLAFLLVGAGMQTTQTAGLALACDLSTPSLRPRVVALMYLMLLVGMAASSLVLGFLLIDFTPVLLIRVIQGAASLTLILNLIALWKQEARQPHLTAPHLPRKSFSESWKLFSAQKKVLRFLLALGIGTAAFSMQDIILEPYGAEVLHLSVSSTTVLTFITALGAICAFALAAKCLNRSIEAYRLAAIGALLGILAFTCVIFSEPLQSPWLFRCGAFLIGFGGGLFSVSTLTAAMSFETDDMNGLVLGAWGAVQATAAGLAIALGGLIRDLISSLAQSGLLGSALDSNATGYSFVYHLEFYLLFATLIVLGPLVAYRPTKMMAESTVDKKFGLAELPG
ncbi:BCD family MFS transporter [Polynucleobacter sp. IMCC30063]|uniref:BCD family MFS transporter n=1 Tax=unclassified Polynucleobacter TaxID=2640945 RepID=UPI001F1D9E7B|nr:MULTISPECIES: BCD family MFS transporter [unclassified Polynucleobacter]MCE7505099.1 BCD family MFS transporter [Polynucleobacter sp. IMCC30063]MCE7526109.1 BCD family MFS transporter [Polynucleobacter sp. IMCC 30228]MCE7528416.1 BCD family MFS transporter [Polynucleobacter sp. IMCC 29146]